MMMLFLLSYKAEAGCSILSSSMIEIYNTLSLEITSTEADPESAFVALSSGPGELIFLSSSSVQVSNTSSQSISVFFTDVGEYSVLVSCDSGNSSSNYSVGELNLISSSEWPNDIGDEFAFNLSFQDGLQANTTYSCLMSLFDSNNDEVSSRLEGTLEVVAFDSSCSFTGLRVKNQGNYTVGINITIQSESQSGYTMQEYESESFTVNSSITSISLDINETVDAYKSLSQLLTVYGDNDQEFLDGYSVVLSVSDGSDIGGIGEYYDVFNSTAILDFYLATSDSIILTVEVMANDGNSIQYQDYNLTVNSGLFVIEPISDMKSSEHFTLQASIKTASNEDIEDYKLGDYNLTIELQGVDYSGTVFEVDGNEYFGIYTQGQASGLINITDVRVLSSGYFTFVFSASSLAVSDTESNYFVCKNSVADLAYSYPMPSNYFTFDIELEVIGDDGNLYLDEANITITENSDLGLEGILYYQTYTGNLTVKDLYFIRPGEAWLTIMVNDYEQNVEFTVNQSKLLITSFTSPKDSACFNLTAEVFDSFEYNIDQLFEHTLNLTLIPTGDNSGTVIEGDLELTKTGVFNFSDLKILSSGNFILKVQSENLQDAETEEFFVENRPLYAEITTEFENITVFEEFEIEVKLFGEDWNTFLGSETVTLLSSPEFMILNNDLLYFNNESIYFTAYARKSGTFHLNVTVANGASNFFSQELWVTVNKAYIELQAEPNPTNSLTKFKIQAFIVSESGQLLENADGIEIELSINCTEYVNCTQPALDDFIEVQDGIGNSSELRILSWGYFEIQACGHDLHHASIVLGEIRNFVIESVIKVSKESFTIYEDIQVEVLLYGDDGLEYFGETK